MRVRKHVALRYIQRLQEDHHDSIKWAWIVILGGGLLKALYELSGLAPCYAKTVFGWISVPLDSATFTAWTDMQCPSHVLMEALLLFFVFALTIVRFFLGNNRYLDAKYIETMNFFEEAYQKMENRREFFWEQYKLVVSRYRRRDLAFDVFFVIVNGSILIIIGSNIKYVDIFVFSYAILLLFDSLWLFLSIKFSKVRHTKFWAKFITEKRYIEDVTADSAPRKWILNNTIHAVLMIAAVFLLTPSDECSGIDFWHDYFPLFFFLLFSNCALDFFLSMNVYFPRIEGIHRNLSNPAEDLPPENDAGFDD